MLKNRSWVYFWLVLSLVIFAGSRAVLARGKIRIVRIVDTNLFQTASGRMVVLANIKTISLRDSNTFRHRFALQVERYEKRNILDQEFLEEAAGQRDSVQIVHLWKKYPLARISVNETFLRKGYGWFDPVPQNRYTKKYQKVAREAKNEGVGLYDRRRFLPKVLLKKNAFWISGGLGWGKQIFSKYGADGILAIDLSLQYRRKMWAISGGEAYWRLNEATGGGVNYLALGRSFHDRHFESVFWVGFSRNRLYHDSESICGIYKTNYFYSLHLKMQTFIHFPQVLGMGFSVTANIHRGYSYFMTYFNLHLGGWNF